MLPYCCLLFGVRQPCLVTSWPVAVQPLPDRPHCGPGVLVRPSNKVHPFCTCRPSSANAVCVTWLCCYRLLCHAVVLPCRYDFFVLESPLLPQGVSLGQVVDGIAAEEVEEFMPIPGGVGWG